MPRRPTLTCSKCAKLMWAGSTSRPQGEATCQPCRTAHGTSGGYDKGCRCAECREAARVRLFEWRARCRAEGRPWRCGTQKNRSGIRDSTRLEVSERDGWVCQICDRPVERNGDPNGNWAPSMDHIVPRISALVPNNAAADLRLAHRLCNALRKDDIRSDAEVRQIVGRRNDFADITA